MSDSFTSNFDIGDWDYFGDYDDEDDDEVQITGSGTAAGVKTTTVTTGQSETSTTMSKDQTPPASTATSQSQSSADNTTTAADASVSPESIPTATATHIKLEPGTTPVTATATATCSSANLAGPGPDLTNIKNEPSTTTTTTTLPTATVNPQPQAAVTTTVRLRSVPLTPTILRITSKPTTPIGQGGSASGNMNPGASAAAAAGSSSPPGAGVQEVPDLMDWSAVPDPGQSQSSSSAAAASASATTSAPQQLQQMIQNGRQNYQQRLHSARHAKIQELSQKLHQHHQFQQQQRLQQAQQHHQTWQQQQHALHQTQHQQALHLQRKTSAMNANATGNSNALAAQQQQQQPIPVTASATSGQIQTFGPSQGVQNLGPQAVVVTGTTVTQIYPSWQMGTPSSSSSSQPTTFGAFQPHPFKWVSNPLAQTQPQPQQQVQVTSSGVAMPGVVYSAGLPAPAPAPHTLMHLGPHAHFPAVMAGLPPGPLPPNPTLATLNAHFNYYGFQPAQPKHNSASGFTPMCSWVSPIPITAECPSPPGWEASLDAGMQTYTPYHKIPIDGTSQEYQVLTQMIGPSCQGIVKIERVVNNELWNKFVKERKEILASKAEPEDTVLLSGLGLTDREISHRIQRASNFDKDPSLGPYSDNMALLFHCTRGNIEAVLTQGLDERLGNVGGLLGKGIYFADDAKKSMTYDSTAGMLMIFAVYLGDCFNVSHLHHKKNLVREPEKKGRQKRNQADLFFDSIVGRHSTGNGEFNEYVIYNRKQCCPMYLVSYQKQMNSPSMSILQERPQPSASSGYEDAYQKARATLPPFAWTNGTPIRSPNWPLFAKNVFDLMKDGVDLGLGLGSAASIFAPPRSLLPETPFLDDTDTDTAMKLSAILGLGIQGYMDDVTNVRLLRRFRYNLEDTIDYILQLTSEKGSADRAIDDALASFAAGASASASASSSSSTAAAALPSTSTSTAVREDNISSIISKTGAMGGFPHPQLQQAKSKSREKDSNRPEQAFCLKKVKLEPNDRDQDGLDSPDSDFSSPSQSPKEEKNDDCPICCMDYPSGDNYWKILPCTHKLCIPCHDRLESKGVTMSGVEHTFLKCPFCQSCSGKEIGSCPNGVMNVTQGYYDCAGYEGYGSLCINYDIQRSPTSKYSLNRTAYLPNSPKGNNVLALLQTAFDRRLIFSIGTSMTTGRTDTLVWNIHHKTQLQGGAQVHGYPDPTYLDRVLDELKQYGLELKNDQVVPAIAINKT